MIDPPSGEVLTNVSVDNWVELERVVIMNVTVAFESNGTRITKVFASEMRPGFGSGEAVVEEGDRSATVGLDMPVDDQESVVYKIKIHNETNYTVDSAIVAINRTDT